MNDVSETSTDVVEAQPTEPIQAAPSAHIPLYRRDLHPGNVVLSASDIKEFFELLDDVISRTRELEYNQLDLSTFDSPEHARARLLELIPLEYNYRAGNGDSFDGLGVPDTAHRTFPEDLDSFFISNASFSTRAINQRPMNTVEVLVCFQKPTLKIDMETFPSNPTENPSIIEIKGRDEDWVISTAERIQEFFRSHATKRPFIHGAGSYDYFIYLAFLPAMFWLFVKQGSFATDWLEKQTTFLNVLLGVYAILLSLLFARFMFQYVRWLFPPMEYYKRSRWKSYVHRSVAGLLISTVILGAAYDIVKSVAVGIMN